MTNPLSSAAEALRSIPSLKMKSLEQRREIARVVLEATTRALAGDEALDKLGEVVIRDSYGHPDDDGDCVVYKPMGSRL